jgi:transcription initiation factor IIE alpha subunit
MKELWAIEDHFLSSLLESLSNGTVGVNIIEEILEDTQLFDERITNRIDYLKSAVGTR